MTKVLITDGSYKHTLGIIRHLPHEYNKNVISTSSKLITLCFYSKYCDHIIEFHDINDEKRYVNELINELKSKRYDVLIPVGFKSCSIIYRYGEEISKYTKLMYPVWDSFIIASEKDKTMSFADKYGVPIPKTLLIKSEQDLYDIASYPVVLKASGGTGGFVKYCYNKKELLLGYNSLNNIEKKGVLCQEYIHGFGCGYFGLYDNGKRIASFMHKRVKEYPVSGGPSVVAESYYDSRLESYGNTLCEKLNWTGPIMCEFKYDDIHDDYKLIEINPKLWGSLDLTLEAGVNIPKLIVEYLTNRNPDTVTKYRYVRFRWILSGEFIHFLETRHNERLSEFIRLKKNEITDIRFDDLLPTLYLTIQLVIKVLLMYVKKHNIHNYKS